MPLAGGRSPPAGAVPGDGPVTPSGEHAPGRGAVVDLRQLALPEARRLSLAAVQRVVMAAEHAQYADAGLLGFRDPLTGWVRDLPVFVLVFAHQELGQVRPGGSAPGGTHHTDSAPA
jgi:hypothetical protein